MGAGNAFDTLLLEHTIEFAPGAAIPVGHKDGVVAPARGMDLGTHGCRDFLGAIVQLRRQAGDFHLQPLVGTTQRCNVVRQRTAGDDQYALGFLRHVCSLTTQLASATARRFAISPLAVSTAMAASRQ